MGLPGGFKNELIKGITANSNAYASKNLKGSNFAGNLEHPITVEVMHHFLDIILKISIENHQISASHVYFSLSVEIFFTPGELTKKLVSRVRLQM